MTDELLKTTQCEEVTCGADSPHESCGEWNDFMQDCEDEEMVCDHCGKRFLVTG